MPSSRMIRLAVAALVVLASVAAGFALVDASVLRGETAVNSSVGTAQVDEATASLSDPVTLFVPGDGWLAAAVAERIAADLSARGATVMHVDQLDEPTDTPVLVVAVTEADVSYSPVSPIATVAASFAYVQSGNATLAQSLVADDPMIVSSNADAYVVGGDVTVADRATGVVTWPAYQRRVGTATSEAVVEALASAPGMDQPN